MHFLVPHPPSISGSSLHDLQVRVLPLAGREPFSKEFHVGRPRHLSEMSKWLSAILKADWQFARAVRFNPYPWKGRGLLIYQKAVLEIYIFCLLDLNCKPNLPPNPIHNRNIQQLSQNACSISFTLLLFIRLLYVCNSLAFKQTLNSFNWIWKKRWCNTYSGTWPYNELPPTYCKILIRFDGYVLLL